MKYIIRGIYGLISIDKNGIWWHSNENISHPVTTFTKEEAIKQARICRYWVRKRKGHQRGVKIIPIK